LCLQCLLVAAMARAPAIAQNAPSRAAPEPVAPADPADLLFASPTRIDHIGRIVVGVNVNGQGPFRFIVDTGANYSTISPGLATQLKLTPSMADGIIVNGITGTAPEPSVAIARLQAGDLVMEDLRIPVIWASLMSGAQGILGLADLEEDRLFVDFEHDQVKIVRSRHGYLPQDFVRIPATRLSGGLLSVDGRLGGVRVVAIIDTGSSRTIANTALQNALNEHRYRRKADAQIREVYGATADIARGELETAPMIDLGDVRIGSVGLVYGDFHIFDVWGLTQRPAMIIGMDVLGTVRALSIDFHEPAIYVSSKDNLGFSVQDDPSCRLLRDSETARCHR
jgi:predicted aspartyl protease